MELLHLLLTPAFLEFWGEMIVASLLMIFIRLWLPDLTDVASRWRAQYFILTLIAFIVAIALLALGTSMWAVEQAPAYILLYPSAAIVSYFFTKFTYRLPNLPPTWQREERSVARIIAGLVALECGIAAYRFVALGQGQMTSRTWFMNAPMMLVVLWLMSLFARQAVRIDQAGPSNGPWISRLAQAIRREPATIDARALRDFTIALLPLLVLGILIVWHPPSEKPATAMYHLTAILSTITLMLTTLIYVNYYSPHSTLFVQVPSVVIMVIVVVLSVAGWMATQRVAVITQSTTWETPARRIIFTPAGPDTYRAQVLPMTPDQVDARLHSIGSLQPLALDYSGLARVDLPFSFQFFGQTWSTVYMHPLGYLTFGSPQQPGNIEWRYGAVPTVFALYRTGLNTTGSRAPSWQLFAATSDRQARFVWSSGAAIGDTVFEVLLNADGSLSIDQTRVGTAVLSAEELTNARWKWRTGIHDGDLNHTLQTISWDGLNGRSIIAAHTLIDDLEVTLRKLAHPISEQLALLMFLSALAAVITLPFILRVGLYQPMRQLLNGIKRTQAGDLSVQIPIYQSGEVSTITQAFNQLVASQRALLEDLKTQVRERTHSEERFRRVVTSISDYAYAVTVDPATRDFTVDYVSPHLKDLIAANEDAVELLHVWKARYVAPEDWDALDRHTASMLAGHDSQTEYRLLQPGGGRIWIRASVRCEQADSAQIRCYGVISNISDRKLLEQETATRQALQEIDRLRGEWLGNMSHELRTPLGLIKAASTTLLAEDIAIPPPVQQRILRQIDYEADRLSDLVNTLLDLSRLDAARLKLDYAPADVAAMLREVVDAAALRMRLGSSPPFRVELELDPPRLDAVVDRERLKRVVQNLLTNATKFSPDHSLITIRARFDQHQLVIEVEDHGVGIDEADFERIFERYYQISQPGLRTHSGAGLGLPICREIVVAHGGTITLTSRKADERHAGGTTFTVRIPRAPLPADSSTHSPAQ